LAECGPVLVGSRHRRGPRHPVQLSYAARLVFRRSSFGSASRTTWLQHPKTLIHAHRPLIGSSTCHRSIDGCPQACSVSESISTSSRMRCVLPPRPGAGDNSAAPNGGEGLCLLTSGATHNHGAVHARTWRAVRDAEIAVGAWLI